MLREIGFKSLTELLTFLCTGVTILKDLVNNRSFVGAEEFYLLKFSLNILNLVQN
jgi:hypothetical protein